VSFNACFTHCLSQGIFGGGEAAASDYMYADAIVGPVDEAVFQPPTACHRAAAMLKASGAAEESTRLRMRSVKRSIVRSNGA
jgi:hypothetical protein